MKNCKKSIFSILGLIVLFIIGFSASGMAFPDPGDGDIPLRPPDPPHIWEPPANSDGKVSLLWTISDGATLYKVYRSDSKYGTYQFIGSTSSYYYKDSPVYGTKWYYVRAHNNLGDSGGSNKVRTQLLPWGVDRIDAERVWGNFEGDNHVVLGNNAGQGINVLLIDSGIDYSHYELQDNYIWGYDWVDDDFDPMDEDGHGTHCAGIIAAVDNSFGIIGTAPNVNLYVARASQTNDIIDSIYWAGSTYYDSDPNNNIDIISISMGVEDYQLLNDVCEYARNEGVVIVAAAGNFDDYHPSYNVEFPANYDSVISVGATDQNNQRADFSCYVGDLDVVAPGVDIVSTCCGYLDGSYYDNDGIVNGYAILSGTSMACPHVTGVVALILSASNNIYNLEGSIRVAAVEECLFNTANSLDIPDYNEGEYGNGLVNASAAVNYALWNY